MKDLIKKMKWEATGWNKLVIIHILGKGLAKDDQGHESSEKCKLKPQSDCTALLSEYPKNVKTKT